MNEELRQLRKKFDSKDPFIAGGHQILKPRSDDKKSVPEWALNDKKVKEIILRSFPKFNTDTRQRKGAARWIRIIHLYWRMNQTRGQVAEEMGLKYSVVNNIIAAIKRVARGRRADNTDLLGHNKKGRPKKVMIVSEPLLAEHAKPNLFRTRSLVSNRTNRKSKRHARGRIQVRSRRS